MRVEGRIIFPIARSEWLGREVRSVGAAIVVLPEGKSKSPPRRAISIFGKL